MNAINKARPSSLKGTYLKNVTLAPTMGPGVKVNPLKVTSAAATEEQFSVDIRQNTQYNVERKCRRQQVSQDVTHATCRGMSEH